MMSKYTYSQRCHFLHAFEHIKEYGPEFSYLGVCANLQAALDKLYYEEETAALAYGFMSDIVDEWPETYIRSNSSIRGIEYPIGGVTEYFSSNNKNSMFDKSTEHGLKRCRLIDYCIERLKDELPC